MFIKNILNLINKFKSFDNWIGFKFIKSILLLIPSGLLDLNLWRNIKWIKIINNIKKGKKKWIEKNRLIRILLILKFPQSHERIISPIYGIDAIKLVITIIAQ